MDALLSHPGINLAQQDAVGRPLPALIASLWRMFAGRGHSTRCGQTLRAQRGRRVDACFASARIPHSALIRVAGGQAGAGSARGRRKGCVASRFRGLVCVHPVDQLTHRAHSTWLCGSRSRFPARSTRLPSRFRNRGTLASDPRLPVRATSSSTSSSRRCCHGSSANLYVVRASSLSDDERIRLREYWEGLEAKRPKGIRVPRVGGGVYCS